MEGRESSMEQSIGGLELPGFRFHPTEEELLDFYLRKSVQGKKLHIDIIGTLNLYRHDPWELPGLAKIGEREWYFFVPRDRKPSNGGRPNRTTERGFWKATGSDRPIRSAADPKRLIGLKKTLVYYEGRAPRGSKTDWVMNEYRLPETTTPPKEDIVLCKVYRKATPMKELEQRAAMASPNSGWTVESSSSPDQESSQKWMAGDDDGGVKEAKVEQDEVEVQALAESTWSVNLPSLEVPTYNVLEWMQDPFSLTQLRSPWMDSWSPNYASVLNF